MQEAASTPLPVAGQDDAETCAAKGKRCACGKPPRPRSRRRLSSIHDVKAALADILWKLEQHQVEPGHARTLIYGYSILAGVITRSDLEARVKELMAASK